MCLLRILYTSVFSYSEWKNVVLKKINDRNSISCLNCIPKYSVAKKTLTCPKIKEFFSMQTCMIYKYYPLLIRPLIIYLYVNPTIDKPLMKNSIARHAVHLQSTPLITNSLITNFGL